MLLIKRVLKQNEVWAQEPKDTPGGTYIYVIVLLTTWQEVNGINVMH